MPPDDQPPPGLPLERAWPLLALALLLALAAQVTIFLRSPVIENDGVTFIQMARDLARSPAETIRGQNQHPGYPAMILAGHGLVRALGRGEGVDGWVLAARLATGLCGLLAVGAGWLFARRLFDRRAACVSGLLLAGLPLFRRNAADAMSDSPHLLFLLLAAWAAVAGLRSWRARWFLLAGVAGGLAYWVRPEGLLVPAVTATCVLLAFVRRPRPKAPTAAVCLAALVASSVALSAPYALLKGQITTKKHVEQLAERRMWLTQPAETKPPARRPTPAPAPAPRRRATPEKRAAAPGGGRAAAVPAATRPHQARAVRPPAAPARPTKKPPRQARPSRPAPAQRPSPAPARRVAPLLIVGQAFGELGSELLEGFYYGLVLPLVVGIFLCRRSGPRDASSPFVPVLWLLHGAVLVMLYVLVRYISHRHAMPLVAVALPWAGCGTICIARLISRAPVARRIPPGWVLAGVVALVLAGMAPRTLRPMHARRLPVVKAARWVGRRADPGDKVLSNTNYVPFYADMPGDVIMRHESLPAGAADATPPAYRFVVFDADTGAFNPRWPAALAAGYRRIEREFPGPVERDILIYEAVPPDAPSG
jgi:4-amino-4-deoxy-L-arabinose transferase-like glycosyltransferase